jgi:hypothetical protein
MGLLNLATTLGMCRDPNDAKIHYLELGTLIFPDSKILARQYYNAVLHQNAENGSRSARKKIRRQVTAVVGSAATWVNLSKMERKSIHAGEVAITAIGKFMGIQADPAKLVSAYMALGSEIYGSKAIADVGKRVESRGRRRLPRQS